jgi:hypothetical protein
MLDFVGLKNHFFILKVNMFLKTIGMTLHGGV